MNVWNPPSRLRLWAARLLAASGAALGAVPAFQTRVTGQLFVSLCVEVVALWLCGKRRFRFAAALWFGCSAFFQLLTSVDRGSASPGWGLAGAVPLALATALLVWPVLKAPSEQARLAPLSGVWALVATLVVTAVDSALLRHAGTLPHDSAFIAGASALALFAGCSLASQLGPFRWPVQLLTVGLIGAAQTSELHSFSTGGQPALDLAKLVAWLGLGTFALGLDWIRAGAGSRTRFLRAGALSLGVSAVPLALAAWWTPVGAEVVAMAVARAAALGLVAAIMPRVAGRGRPVFRLSAPVGVPPWPLMGLILGAGLLAIFFIAREGEAVLGVAAALVPAFLFMVFRTRFTRAALFLMAGVPLLVGSFGALKAMESGALSMASLVALGVLGYCITGPAAGRHFQRRLRWASLPRPRVSLALAGVAALGLVAAVVAISVTRPQARSGLLASAGGSVPLPLPLYFRAGELRDAPSPGRLTGATVAVDPKGRGTWVVDEERDEVVLVGEGEQARRFPVGDWPELLVVTREGRVFVSCREAARIDVIEPDFQRRAIEVNDEVRGLALDPSERRLYAGLLLSRALESFDAQTLERLGRVALDADPRSVAVTAAGVAALPDRGRAVEMGSADLRRHWSVPLPEGEGVAWHGQALLPAGRDLLVLHAQVNTGLERPVSGGGYGGSVSQPIELVATVIEGGRAPLVPPNARMMASRLGVPDVSGAALGDGALYLASRIKGQVERVPFASGGRLDASGRSVVALSEPTGVPAKAEPAEELAREELEEREDLAVREEAPVAAGNGMTGLALDGGRLVTFAAFDRVLVSASTRGAPQRVEAKLGAGRLDAQLARGRRLFFRNDRAVSSAGLACASCHVDGREDGLVWRLQGGRLQTPSLTGRLADTAPYNWHGTTKNLSDNIAQTIERLGGTGLEPSDRRALARYLSEGLRPVRPAPVPAGDAAMVAQGRALFHDRTVGCSSCHDSASGYTDGQAHDVETLSAAERAELEQSLGKAPEASASAFDTPALRQVGLTAPYFHDGSAKTLEAVVEGNGDRMGKTSHLSAGERRALVAYLGTL